MNRKYITTPIYYVNGSPHIGHAYTSIVSDFISRFYRQCGSDVFLLTGTDEHGQKVAQSAEKQNINPQDFCDSVSAIFKNLANKCNVNYSDFIRTTEDRHKTFVQKIWQKLEKNGWFYKSTYNGWYSIQDEAFYDDSEIVNGLAPSGSKVEWKEEDSYFFRLSKFTDVLSKWFEENPKFVFPFGRFNEVKSFVKSGLTDLSISRSTFSWGIKIPDTNHVMYVWLDALFNYQSALGENFEKFWQNSSIVHIIGKDILRFHAVYWPAFLTALECTPESLSTNYIDSACKNMQIVSHGWWLSEGEKMSKSVGNTIDPFLFLEQYDSDYLRYFLLREAQFGNDGNFSKDGFKTRINSELINNIGNLCQRTFTLLQKYCDGTIPDCKPQNDDYFFTTDLQKQMAFLLSEYKINQALDCIIDYTSKANEFIQNMQPWNLFKNGDIENGKKALYTLLYVIYQAKEALAPVLPNFYQRISTVFQNQKFSANLQLSSIQKVFEPVE